MRLAHVRSEWQEAPVEISVLKNPVYYLKALNSTYSYLNMLLVLVTGIIVYYVTNKLIAGLLIQLTPFLSFHIITYGLHGWDPKNIVPLEKLMGKNGNRIIMVGWPFHRFPRKLIKPDIKMTDCFGGQYFTIYCL